MVKRRLYRTIRSLLTRDWPHYLQDTVEAINNSPNSAIGFLKPSQIKSNIDDPKIDEKIGIPKDVPVEEQRQNQNAYEKNKDSFQVGDHVYLDFAPSTMEKGFDTPVRKCTQNTVSALQFSFRPSSCILRNILTYMPMGSGIGDLPPTHTSRKNPPQAENLCSRDAPSPS